MLKKIKEFTLVEIIIVIASIGILAMVLVPTVVEVYYGLSSNNSKELIVPTENKIEKKDLKKL